MTDREKYLKVLETWKLRNSKPTKNQLGYVEGWIHEDDLRALDYAISSIKTDLKYDLIYEGEEVYTKTDVVAMLTEIQLEIEKKSWGKRLDGLDPAVDMVDVNTIIQQKINALKGE